MVRGHERAALAENKADAREIKDALSRRGGGDARNRLLGVRPGPIFSDEH